PFASCARYNITNFPSSCTTAELNAPALSHPSPRGARIGSCETLVHVALALRCCASVVRTAKEKQRDNAALRQKNVQPGMTLSIMVFASPAQAATESFVPIGFGWGLPTTLACLATLRAINPASARSTSCPATLDRKHQSPSGLPYQLTLLR